MCECIQNMQEVAIYSNPLCPPQVELISDCDNPIYVRQCGSDFEKSIRCEIDGNGDLTGVQVLILTEIDEQTKLPTTNYYNLITSAPWSGDPSTDLVKCPDQELESDAKVFCDEGTEFIRRYVKKNGEPTGDTFDTDFSGSVYLASGNEVVGTCNTVLDVEQNKKIHTNTTTGEITEIYEVVKYNNDGTVNSTSYINADGTGSNFTVTGTVACEPIRVVLGSQLLTYDDTSVITLTVPANTAGAHIQIHTGVDTKVTVTGTDPVTGETGIGNVVKTGEEIILHSNNEVNNFKAIAIDGSATGELYVEYFNTSIETGI